MSASAKRVAHDEVERLLGAYALDALDPEETAFVEAHLAQCPRCADEVAAHHEVAGLLANTGADAPTELWDRIADRLGAPGSANWAKLAARLNRPDEAAAGGGTGLDPGDREHAGAVVDVSHQRRLRRRIAMWAGTAVATAAVVVAVVFGVQVGQLNNHVAHLESAASQPGISRAATAALEDPNTTRVVLLAAGASSPGGPSVTVALTASGTAYLIPRNLSNLPSGQTYQLWGKSGGQLISFGLLGAIPTTAVFTVKPGAPVTLYAITAEPAGGVVQPTRPPVVQGSVAA